METPVPLTAISPIGQAPPSSGSGLKDAPVDQSSISVQKRASASEAPAKHKKSVVVLESPSKFSQVLDDSKLWDIEEEEAMMIRRRCSIAEAIAAADGEQQRRIEQCEKDQRVDNLHRKANIAMANSMEHAEMVRRVSLTECAEIEAVQYRAQQVDVARRLATEEQQRRMTEVDINDKDNVIRRQASGTMAKRLEHEEKVRRISEQAKCVEEARVIRETSISEAKLLFNLARGEALIERSMRTGEPIPEEYQVLVAAVAANVVDEPTMVARVVDFVRASLVYVMRQLGIVSQ